MQCFIALSQNPPMDCTIRTMQRDEVRLAVDWAAAEGWNPGLYDAPCFHAADPQGFLLAEVSGEPVGCVSAVSYDGRFGFIGLYIVAPAWRANGMSSVFETARMYAGPAPKVELDAVYGITTFELG